MTRRYIISLILDFAMFVFFAYVWVSFYMKKGFDPIMTILCVLLAIFLLRDAYKLMQKIILERQNNK